MPNWFVINLGDAMLAGEPLGRLEEQLQSAYQQAGRPEEMGAFLSHESNHELHCVAKVYLSPAFVGFATRHGASRCDKPASKDLSLLAGSPNSL